MINNSHKPLKSSWRSEVFKKPKGGMLMTTHSLLNGRKFVQKKYGKIVAGNFCKSNSNPY